MKVFCAKCGTQLDLGSEFCSNCGNKIENNSTSFSKNTSADLVNDEQPGNITSPDIFNNDFVHQFLIANCRYFDVHKIGEIKIMLSKIEKSKWEGIERTVFKDPTLHLVISIWGGMIGLDRFFIGDTGLGIAKLLTFGGCGIWTIVDWFSIQKVTKEKNYLLLRSLAN